jgi:hypothetical protein
MLESHRVTEGKRPIAASCWLLDRCCCCSACFCSTNKEPRSSDPAASSTLPLVEPKPEAVACCWCRGPAPAPPTAFVAAGCCCGRRWRRGGADGGARVALRGRLFRPPRPAPPCPPWATALRPRASRCPAAPRPAARGRRTSRCPRRRSWGGPSTRCPPLALPPLRCAPSVRQSPSPYPARNRH